MLVKNGLEAVREKFFHGEKTNHPISCILIWRALSALKMTDDVYPLNYSVQIDRNRIANSCSNGYELIILAAQNGKRDLTLPSWDQFNSWADEAGKCCGVLPEQVRQHFEPRTWHIKSHFELWLHVVFQLAWKQPPGSSLPNAEKKTWYQNLTVPIRSLDTVNCDSPLALTLLDKIPSPPVRWYAEIPDLFIASRAAADVLLAWGSGSLRHLNHPATFAYTIMCQARWQRCVLNLLAAEIWGDLRPELMDMLAHVDTDFILQTEECRDGRDFPKDRSPGEQEARNRMRALVPFFAEKGGTMDAQDWETIANLERVAFTPGETIDLNFLMRLGAALRAKVKSPPLRVSPESPAMEKTSNATNLEPKFVFRPDGDGYFLRGFGEEGHFSVNGAKGLHDLFRLIQSPGVPVPMLELEAGRGVKQAEGDGRSRQPIADAETLKQISDKRNELIAEIESAENYLERDELQAELDKLETSASKLVGLNGKSRNLNANNLNRMKSNISGRIKTACKNIEPSFPKLAQHFRDTTGSVDAAFYSYTPAFPDLKWDTDKK